MYALVFYPNNVIMTSLQLCDDVTSGAVVILYFSRNHILNILIAIVYRYCFHSDCGACIIRL